MSGGGGDAPSPSVRLPAKPAPRTAAGDPGRPPPGRNPQGSSEPAPRGMTPPVAGPRCGCRATPPRRAKEVVLVVMGHAEQHRMHSGPQRADQLSRAPVADVDAFVAGHAQPLRGRTVDARSMSLSGVIWPVAAEPNMMILSGAVANRMRRTTSSISESSIRAAALVLMQTSSRAAGTASCRIPSLRRNHLGRQPAARDAPGRRIRAP